MQYGLNSLVLIFLGGLLEKQKKTYLIEQKEYADIFMRENF